ncbi:MAG: transporter [Burkholderiales bacterium]|nr:transporter [Burkholderiales bacterium]
MSGAPARRALPVLLWLAAMAGGLLLIWQARFSADLSAFLPAAPDARQRVLIEQLQSGAPARTLLLAIEGGSATQRAEASRRLADRLRRSGLFDQVHNGDAAGWAALGDWLFAQRYLLSPAITPQRFAADGLRDAIDDTLSLLGTPAGARLKPLVVRDPTGETLRIAEQSLGGRQPRVEQGVWAARDGSRALLLASTRAAGADLDAQAAAIARIRQDFVGAAAPGLRLLSSGAPRFAVDSRAEIEAEVRLLAIAGALGMGGLLWLAFGSFGALAVAALPVASGVVGGIAAVSLGFGTVHGITLGFGTTLIGEAVDYAIYYLVQARGPGWRGWLRQGWPTVRLGLLTSVCGFAALAFSGFPGLAQLGVYSVAGLVTAALTTRFVLPVFKPDGAPGTPARQRLGRWAAVLVIRLPRWRHAFSALGLIGLALLAWQHDRLWRAELSSLSPVSPQALALDAQLRAELASADAGTLVVVQADSAEAALQAAEATATKLDELVAEGRLAGFDSVTRWLPSLATQQQRRAALPDAAALRSALAQATEGGPLPAARLTAFVDDVQQARVAAALTPESLRGTAVEPLVNALLLQRPDGGWAALLPVQIALDQPLDAVTLQAALKDIPQAQWIDIGAELSRLYRHYLGEAQAQALLGALGVVVLMGLWLRSGRRLLAVCLPLAMAVLLTLAGLAALNVALGILHLVGLLLVVAVGSNYVLFFDLLRDEAPADADTLASLLLANATTVLSFGLIAFSQIPALSAIGRVVAPGALLALLLAAAYAPARSTKTPV